MTAIDFTPAAYRDLADIWFYTYDHWGEKQADTYVATIHATLAMAARNPSVAGPWTMRVSVTGKSRPVVTYAISPGAPTVEGSS